MDWVEPNFSDPTEKMEDNMSSLTVGFAARMRKRATSAQEEAIPGFQVYGKKRPKLFDLDEEAQKSLRVITVDSPKRSPMLYRLWKVPFRMLLERLVHRWRKGSQPRGLPMLMEA